MSLLSRLADADALRARALAISKERDAIAVELEVASIGSLLDAAGRPEPLVDREGFPRADVDVHAVRAARHALARATTDYADASRRLEAALLAVHAAAPAAGAGAGTPPGGGGGGGATGGGATGGGATGGGAPDAATARLEYLRSRGIEVVLRSSAAGGGGASGDGAGAGGRDEGAGDGGGGPSGDGGARATAVVARALCRVDEVAPGSPAADAGLRVGDRVLSIGGVSGAGGGGLRELAEAVRAGAGEALAVLVERAGGETVTLSLTPRAWAGQGLLGCHVVPTE